MSNTPSILHAGNGSDAAFSRRECRRAFAGVPFLSALSDEDNAALSPLMQPVSLAAGEYLFFEGDPSDAVYFLLEGRVEVFKSDDLGGRLPLVTLEDAGVLGEMGLLSNAPRTATARVLSSVRALVVTSVAFEAALNSGNLAAFRLALAFARVVSQRLAAMDNKLFTLFQTDEGGARFRDLDDLRHRLLTSWIV